MRPYIDLSDEELVAEIKSTYLAKRQAVGGGVGVVAGEGRRVEYTRANLTELSAIIRDLGYEARLRGLPIGGSAGALRVEIG